ncbi:hypothetical protein RJI07_05155 [Mycoplasmatota bacterium WC30]
MLQKIREYVFYQLRFDTESGNEELKEEIISNISDRYDEFYDKTKDKNYAYVQAIKSMGDFTEGKNQEAASRAYKPSIPELFLISGVILAVFGLVIVLFSVLVGAIVIMLSILAFSVGASYLYQESQYIKEVEFDIEKHNDYLTKIFSYIKTCFVFWAIGLSFILAAILNSIISYFVLLNAGISGSQSGIITALIVSIWGFILFFIILLFVFKKIYQRLLDKYYELTGVKDLKSKIDVAKNFLRDDSKEGKTYKPTILDRYWFYPSIILVTLVMALFTQVWIGGYHYGISVSEIFLLLPSHIADGGIVTVYVLLFSIPMLAMFVVAILSLTKTIKNRIISPVSYIILTVFYLALMTIELKQNLNVGADGAVLFFFVSIAFIILLIVGAIRNSFKPTVKGE